jgi:glycosyltransferase involved in cell wall biosynthesis
MKVLFLAHSFPRHRGDAAGSFLLRLAVALRELDITVQVVAPHADDLSGAEEIDGIRVERFRYAPKQWENLAYTGEMAQRVQSSWSARLAMLSFLGADFVGAVQSRRRFEPDLVHAHWWFPGGLVGTWVAGLSNIPLVTTLHGTDVRIARSVPAARPVFRHIVKQSAVVTTVSHWLSKEVFDLTQKRPIVAPMPVASELFSSGGTRERERLLFVGRLNEQKGIAVLLQALAAMRTKVSLDVIGDGPARTQLNELATSLGITSRVRFLGELPQPALVDHYRSATALVVPSTGEGLGLVAVEAMMCKTPVVAFDSGGLVDVVQHDRTGILVPPGDVPALARALDDLLARPDRGAALGEAGRMYALSAFAPESAAQRYADVYRSALATVAT